MNFDKNKHPHHHAPYLFAYDIACPARGRKLLRCLKEWRVDGQLSVHETILHEGQAKSLAAQALTLVDPKYDRLLLGKLSARGDGPIYHWRGQKMAPALKHTAHTKPLPQQLHRGLYLLSYDIREPRRLRQAHKHIAEATLFVQRSLYFYQGGGKRLSNLIDTVSERLQQGEDDLRLYSIQKPSDLWFLCGETPALDAFKDNPTKQQPLWRRLFGKRST